jgi:hypothetical protein
LRCVGKFSIPYVCSLVGDLAGMFRHATEDTG